MLNNIVVGRSKDFSFRHRMLNALLLGGTLSSLIIAMFNLGLNQPQLALTTSLFATACLSGLFYLSRIRRLYFLPVVSIFFLTVVVIPPAWVSSGGSLSHLPYLVTAFIPMLAALLEKDKRLIFFSILILLINSLLVWKFFHPSILQISLYSPERYIGLSITLTVSMICIAITSSLVFDSYRKESFRARVYRGASRKTRRNYNFLCCHDKLTCTFNRAKFNADVLHLENGPDQQIGVFYFDIDRLKFINDTLGHQSGDELLQQATQTLHSIFPENCRLYRISGDEFVILLANSDEHTLERLYEDLSTHFHQLHSQSNLQSFPLCMTYAYSIGSSKSIWNLIKDAECKLFRHMLLHHTRNEQTIIQTVKQMLRSRDYSTGEH